MRNSELKALIASEHADALSASSASQLSNSRASAQDFYLGDMSKELPVPVGSSSAVSMDVSDTIEGMMPQLLDIFTGSDEVVRFEPVGPEDVEAAQQETDYINHVFMNQNEGFMTLYSMIKDALLSKVGIVKVFWEEREEEQRETYYDKTDDEYAILAADPNIEIVEHTAHPPGAGTQGEGGPDVGGYGGQAAQAYQPVPDGPGLPGGGGQPVVTLHDVTVVSRKDYSCAKVMAVPPEEFGARADTRILREANYCYHKVISTVGRAIAQGYDPEQIKNLPTKSEADNQEEINRDTVNENRGAQSSELNEMTREIEIVEHYVRMDYEGNGKSALYRVVTGGVEGEILRCRSGEKAYEDDIKPWDAIPFASITPVPQTHRFYGRSIADLVMDIQKIKTALVRGLLDNMYMVLNPRVEVSDKYTNENTLDDLLVSRPGGVVRSREPGGINWQKVPSIGADLYPALDYLDAVREERTGVSRRGQALDANTLANQSATSANIAYSVSQAQIKMIAKIAAETGIKDLFWLLHATVKKHAQKAQVVRLRNSWVTVDPRNWKTRNDLTVHVGLGTGDKAHQMGVLMQILTAQKELLMGGKTNLVTDDNLFNSLKKMTRIAGEPDAETYFSNPKGQPAPQPPPDPKLIELQMKAQLEERSDQRKAQIEQVQAQADIATQQQKTAAEIHIAERRAQLEEQTMLLDHQLKREEHAQNMVMKRELHEHTLAQNQMGMVANAQAHDAKMAQMKQKHAD